MSRTVRSGTPVAAATRSTSSRSRGPHEVHELADEGVQSLRPLTRREVHDEADGVHVREVEVGPRAEADRGRNLLEHVDGVRHVLVSERDEVVMLGPGEERRPAAHQQTVRAGTR